MSVNLSNSGIWYHKQSHWWYWCTQTGEGRGEMVVNEEEWRESAFYEGNWRRDFGARCPSCRQSVLKTSTAWTANRLLSEGRSSLLHLLSDICTKYLISYLFIFVPYVSLSELVVNGSCVLSACCSHASRLTKQQSCQLKVRQCCRW